MFFERLKGYSRCSCDLSFDQSKKNAKSGEEQSAPIKIKIDIKCLLLCIFIRASIIELLLFTPALRRTIEQVFDAKTVVGAFDKPKRRSRG